MFKYVYPLRQVFSLTCYILIHKYKVNIKNCQASGRGEFQGGNVHDRLKYSINILSSALPSAFLHRIPPDPVLYRGFMNFH